MSARVKLIVELHDGLDEQTFQVDLESRLMTMDGDSAAAALATLDCGYTDARMWLEARTIPASKNSKPL